VPRGVDVEDFAVGARFEVHPRPALEFSPPGQLPVREIELPEFRAAEVLEQPVGDVPPGRQREGERFTRSSPRPNRDGRTQREEVDGLCGQIDAADAHGPTARYRIGDGEEGRLIPWRLVDAVPRA